MSSLPSGLDRVSKGFGVHRLALAACIALLLAGCSNSAEPPATKPYVVQVDCAKIMDGSQQKQPPEQFVTYWYSDGTSTQEVKPGQCAQESNLYPLQP